MKKEVENQEYLRQKMLFSAKNYARFIVNYVTINYDKEASLDNILEQIGINEKVFGMCLKKVRKTDPTLYNRYMTKKTIRDLKQIDDIKIVINDIINGINNGYFNDGKEFSTLELLKRLPFSDNPKSLYYLHKFITENMPEGRPLLDFLGKNKLINNGCVKNDDKFWLRQVINSKTIINGREITPDENNMLIEYMVYNHIPLYSKIFLYVRKLYLNGEINLVKGLYLEEDTPLQRVLKKDDE